MTIAIRLSTAKTVDEVAVALQSIVSANQLGVTHVYNFKELTKKGVQFAMECVIVEVGKLRQPNDALDEDAELSTALPCRISIYAKDGRTMLVALKPTFLLAIFSSIQLAKAARKVEAMMVKLMRQAARGNTNPCVAA